MASINISQQLRLNNLVTAVNGTILREAAGQLVHQDNETNTQRIKRCNRKIKGATKQWHAGNRTVGGEK